jgi:hypothetical protein
MTRARTWLLAVGLMGLATACNPAGARSDDEVEETEQRAPVLVEPLVKGSIEASIEASRPSRWSPCTPSPPVAS